MLATKRPKRHFAYCSASYCKPFSPVIHPAPRQARDPALKTTLTLFCG